MNAAPLSNIDLLSTSEAADLLHMSVRRVQRWAKDGKLPYVRQLPGPSGAYLFDRAVLTGNHPTKETNHNAKDG